MQGSLRTRFAFLLAAGGIGLCGYAGLQWFQLPHFNEDDLKASTELNLQLDLAQRKDQTPLTPEQLEQKRQEVRQEVEDEIGQNRKTVLTRLALGAALLVFALGQWFAARLVAHRQS
jgi:glucose-6-phosphate-specific signal transduction histidine kinase